MAYPGVPPPPPLSPVNMNQQYRPAPQPQRSLQDLYPVHNQQNYPQNYNTRLFTPNNNINNHNHANNQPQQQPFNPWRTQTQNNHHFNPHNSLAFNLQPGLDKKQKEKDKPKPPDPVQTTLEGYRFRKDPQPPKGGSTTWSVIIRTELDVEQDELKRTVKQQGAKAAISDQYDNLKSRNQRVQIDKLLDEKKKTEKHPDAKWSLVAIKDKRAWVDGAKSRRREVESKELEVVLKRYSKVPLPPVQEESKDKKKEDDKAKDKKKDEAKEKEKEKPPPKLAYPGVRVDLNEEPKPEKPEKRKGEGKGEKEKDKKGKDDGKRGPQIRGGGNSTSWANLSNGLFNQRQIPEAKPIIMNDSWPKQNQPTQQHPQPLHQQPHAQQPAQQPRWPPQPHVLTEDEEEEEDDIDDLFDDDENIVQVVTGSDSPAAKTPGPFHQQPKPQMQQFSPQQQLHHQQPQQQAEPQRPNFAGWHVPDAPHTVFNSSGAQAQHPQPQQQQQQQQQQRPLGGASFTVPINGQNHQFQTPQLNQTNQLNPRPAPNFTNAFIPPPKPQQGPLFNKAQQHQRHDSKLFMSDADDDEDDSIEAGSSHFSRNSAGYETPITSPSGDGFNGPRRVNNISGGAAGKRMSTGGGGIDMLASKGRNGKEKEKKYKTHNKPLPLPLPETISPTPRRNRFFSEDEDLDEPEDEANDIHIFNHWSSGSKRREKQYHDSGGGGGGSRSRNKAVGRPKLSPREELDADYMRRLERIKLDEERRLEKLEREEERYDLARARRRRDEGKRRQSVVMSGQRPSLGGGAGGRDRRRYSYRGYDDDVF